MCNQMGGECGAELFCYPFQVAAGGGTQGRHDILVELHGGGERFYFKRNFPFGDTINVFCVVGDIPLSGYAVKGVGGWAQTEV